MPHIYIAKSMVLYPEYIEEKCQKLSDQIVIPSYALNMLIDNFDDDSDTSLLMRLINTQTHQETVISIGTPHHYEKTVIYVPQWILDIIGCTGTCNTPVKLELIREPLPLATSITIKPLDPIIFNIDLVECFQTILENLHTLQEGITIPVFIPQLGNYETLAYIEKVEPSKISRTHAGDLDVNFLRDFEEIPRALSPQYDTKEEYEEDHKESDSKEDINEETKEELSEEERRRRVRESWLNRFNKQV
jgi:hypothetical protein